MFVIFVVPTVDVLKSRSVREREKGGGWGWGGGQDGLCRDWWNDSSRKQQRFCLKSANHHI